MARRKAGDRKVVNKNIGDAGGLENIQKALADKNGIAIDGINIPDWEVGSRKLQED